MSKEKLSRSNVNELQAATRSEIRRLQKALATLSCLKVALAEEMWNEIDCEDVATVVCKLIAKSIQNLDVTSPRSRDREH